MPDIILTSETSNTSFSCVGTFWKPKQKEGESAGQDQSPRLSKLFSTNPLKEEDLRDMFVGPKVCAEKFWRAYPVFTPPEMEEGRMQLAPGLYYTNALEAGASCVEIAAVAARNVALLIGKELIDRGQVDVAM
jgi:prenylcysteine oxidase/farnesylcysteine lyase